MAKQKGMVHIYYGDGKGKTTAAVGLILRALGNDFRVAFFQFIKGKPSGELEVFTQMEGVDIFRKEAPATKNGFIKSKPTLEDKEKAEELLHSAKQTIENGHYQLVVLDEALVAVSYGLIPVERLVEIIKDKPDDIEIVITGRGRPGILIDLADYVTEMREIKHPYKKGTSARKGIEY